MLDLCNEHPFQQAQFFFSVLDEVLGLTVSVTVSVVQNVNSVICVCFQLQESAEEVHIQCSCDVCMCCCSTEICCAASKFSIHLEAVEYGSSNYQIRLL